MSEAVSVIVPTFNRASLIRPTLVSVLDQTRPAAEILVIDDGSTDDTQSVVDSMGSGVTYLKKANSGKSASLNLAIPKTSHPLIWIVDDDDIVQPDALEKLTNLFSQNPTASFTFGKHNCFTEDPETGERSFFPTGHWSNVAPENFLISTLEDFYVHQPGMIVRRSLYDTVGPFDESLVRCQDYEMLIRLANAGLGIGIQDIVFSQRQHDGVRGQGNQRFEASKSFEKWIDYGKEIFTDLYRTLPLDAYLPHGVNVSNDALERRARLQRACVMARKRLWDEALIDFATVAKNTGPEFTNDEIAILRRSMASKYGCLEVASDQTVVAKLLDLKRIEPKGRTIVRQLARGLHWRVRNALENRRFEEAFGYARTIGQLRFR